MVCTYEGGFWLILYFFRNSRKDAIFIYIYIYILYIRIHTPKYIINSCIYIIRFSFIIFKVTYLLYDDNRPLLPHIQNKNISTPPKLFFLFLFVTLQGVRNTHPRDAARRATLRLRRTRFATPYRGWTAEGHPNGYLYGGTWRCYSPPGGKLTDREERYRRQ